jgi:4-hydroxybenzoate polyprenyltransferase
VLFWGAGFDVLYACQDFEHDCKVGLNSIPAAIGIPRAFWVSNAMHIAALLFLITLVKVFALGAAAWAGITVVAGLLLYEHLIVSPSDLRRLNAAFFTMNGVISILFFAFIAVDLLWRR